MAATAKRQAEDAKEKGNFFFRKEKLGAAIEAYTEAITLCPTNAVYFTNRALCRMKRNEWPDVTSDCRKALALDSSSVKGHYLLGLALLRCDDADEAVRHLDKALDLARGGNGGPTMVEDVWQELSNAKFKQWDLAASGRRERQRGLRDRLRKLLLALEQGTSLEDPATGVPMDIDNPSARGTGERREGTAFRAPVVDVADSDSEPEPMSPSSPAFEAGLKEMQATLAGRARDESHENGGTERAGSSAPESAEGETGKSRGEECRQSGNAENVPSSSGSVEGGSREGARGHVAGEGCKQVPTPSEEGVRQREEQYQQDVNTLENVFDKAGAPDRPGEVPDHLCCKLTMEIFRDPVITPSGVTYERTAILEHLKKVGKFDPVTRATLGERDLFPNLALKEAIQTYLEEHGWAYKLT